MAIAATHPYDADRRELVRLGLWIFLGTVAMLFAAFTSAYLVRRSGTDWQPIALPPILWINTAILLAGSLSLEVGRVRGTWRPGVAVRAAAHLAALVLGTAFLLGQVLAWNQLAAAGIYLPTNPSSSFFFVLTGAHAVHVLAALGVIAWATVATWTAAPRDAERSRTAADTARLFCHFLFGVWLYVLALISFF